MPAERRFRGDAAALRAMMRDFMDEVPVGSLVHITVYSPERWTATAVYVESAGAAADKTYLFIIPAGEAIAAGFCVPQGTVGYRVTLPCAEWDSMTIGLQVVIPDAKALSEFEVIADSTCLWNLVHPNELTVVVEDLADARTFIEDLRAAQDQAQEAAEAARARSAERSWRTNDELVSTVTFLEQRLSAANRKLDANKLLIEAKDKHIEERNAAVRTMKRQHAAAATAEPVPAVLQQQYEHALAQLDEAANRGIALEAELRAMRLELQTKTREASNATMRCRSLEAANTDLDQRLDALQLDLAAAQEAAVAARRPAPRDASPRTRSTSFGADGHALVTLAEESEAAAARALADRDAKSAQLERVTEDLRSARNKIATFASTQARMKSEHSARITELQDKVAQMDAELKRALSDASATHDSDKQLSSMKQRQRDLESELRRARDSERILKAEVTDAEERADQLQAELDAAVGAQQDLKRQIRALEGRLAASEAAVRAARTRTTDVDVEDELSDLRTRLAAEESARRAEADKHREAARKVRERHLADVAAIKKELEDATTLLDERTAELREARRDDPGRGADSKALMEKDRTIAQLNKQIQKLNTTLESFCSGRQPGSGNDARSSNGASDSTGSDVGYLPLILTASALRPALAPGSALNDAQLQSYQRLLHRIHTGTLTAADHDLILKAPPRQLAEAEQDEADTRSPWQLYMWPLLCSGLDTPEERIACIRSAMSSTSTWITAASQNCTQDISALITAYCHTFTAADDSNARAIYKVYERRLFDLVARFSGIDSNRKAERIAGITTTKRPADPATRLIAYGLSHAASPARGGKGGGGKHKPKHGAT